MKLNDNLTNVSLYDIKWAVKNQYETDVKWVALNVVSLFSQPQQYRKLHKKHFKELVGRTFYTSHTNPACNWSGWWQDIIDVVSVISGQTKPFIEKQLFSLTHSSRETELVSIRLRYFSYTSRRPMFGESSQLKKDDYGKPYMWIIYQDELHPVPEQFLKEQLVLWNNRDLLK